MKAMLLCFWTAILATVTGCFAPKQRPDPLAGWHFSSLNNLDSNKPIAADYQDYIQRLPPDERKAAGMVQFFQDGTGQHAVMIVVGLNGTWWRHILIYDKDNNRIKTVKYEWGRYRS